MVGDVPDYFNLVRLPSLWHSLSAITKVVRAPKALGGGQVPGALAAIGNLPAVLGD